MSGIPTSTSAVTRAQDRLSLHDLHDRLTHYIRHVQDLKYKVQAVDSSAFLESIGVLEEGLATLKQSYEKELNKARNDNEDLCAARNDYASQLKRSQDLVSKLESRLVDENERNEKNQQELNALHRTVAQKDAELHEAQMALRPPTEALEKATRENEKLLRENQDLQKKYTTEESARQELQERNHQLRERVDFQEKMHQQTVQDLTERLHSASENILSLEAKVRELAKPDTSLTDMLSRVRDAAEAQLHMYREESQASFSQSLTALKAQIDQDTRRIEELTAKNVRQHGEMGELMATIRKMEGVMGALEHQKRSLEEIVQNERHLAQQHIANLEDKLRDLQDVLVHKMRELNAARDAQLPLRAEIEALRAILDEEERRLAKLPQLGLIPKPQHGQSGLPMPIFPKVPQAPANRHTVSPRAPTEVVGPVRARSAPAKSASRLIPTSLGQGKDYFNNLFNEVKPEGDMLKVHPDTDPISPAICEAQTPVDRPLRPEPGVNASLWADRPVSTVSHDYPTSTSSATGNLSILEVHPEGKYIRLVNRTQGKDEEFGGYLIQQNVGGHPVAVYRFPPRIRFNVGTTMTVWAGSADPIMHQPPTDFVFKEQLKWGTGPECTTILCKPNGQAVAWTTAAHRFTRNAYDNQTHPMTPSSGSHYGGGDEALNENNNNHGSADDATDEDGQELTEIQLPVNGAPSEAVFLRREKAVAPSLAAQKHPHGISPAGGVHPHTGPPRPHTYGNDNSTKNRQSRVQSSRPDPIPGAPYAGASAQRMGSASLRSYSPTKTTIRGSGALSNQAECVHPGSEWSHVPSAFQRPHERFMTGMMQLQSQHNDDFLPPMPRPPLFSVW